MLMRSFARGTLGALFVSAILIAGCAKKAPAPPPSLPAPPPPAPARPTVTLQASSSFLQKGESVTLNWSSTNATQLDLQPGVGSVAAQGQTRVSPVDSTTYTITASGPGGSASESVRITVSAPPAPVAPKPTATLEELFQRGVADAFFDYDKSDIRPDGRNALAKTAEFLRSYPQVRVIIEGHCDERGSTEYNIALGESRAQAARQFLASLGVSADRMDTTSFGKEKPFCNGHDETCWQQNRRAHFVMAR